MNVGHYTQWHDFNIRFIVKPATELGHITLPEWKNTYSTVFAFVNQVVCSRDVGKENHYSSRDAFSEWKQQCPVFLNGCFIYRYGMTHKRASSYSK